MARRSSGWAVRLPFYYGWLIVAVAFVTMAIGVSGTPSYVVGNEAVFGAVGYDTLQQRIAAARECGESLTC